MRMRTKAFKEAGRDERGISLIFMAIAMTALLAAAAVTIDLGNGWVTRRNLVTSTDAAALAAAQEFALGGDGCAGIDDTYVGLNNPTATGITCTTGGSGSIGWVTVYAEDDVQTWFAPAIGLGDYSASSASTARWGSPVSVTGLRPLSLCAQAFGIEDWIADPSQTITRTVDYSKNGQAPECDSGQNGIPGSWGMMDFNGVAGGNNDSKDWVLNGYDGDVQAGSPNGTCNDEPWACYQPEPGNALPGVKKELEDILGLEIVLPVVNWVVDANGQNAQMHIMGFARVIIVDFKPNGQNAYIEVTFLPGLITGSCCGDNSGPSNVSVIGACAVDNRNVGACGQ